MRRKRKTGFQKRLEEAAKKYGTIPHEVSQNPQSQSAHDPDGDDKPTSQSAPPNPSGNLKWKRCNDELPQYYSSIHLWDGQEVHLNWARVWSETLGNIYVNNRDDTIITKITHWTAPEGQEYPKYNPLTKDDVRLYTKRDVRVVLNKLYGLIKNRDNSKLPSIEYNAGVDDAIITIENATKDKRMTGRPRRKTGG